MWPWDDSFQSEVKRRVRKLVPRALRSEWEVLPARRSKVWVELVVVHRVVFTSPVSTPQPGPLPFGVRDVGNAGKLTSTLSDRVRAQEQELGERVRPWVAAQAASCDALLPPETCLGEVLAYGYQFDCEHCSPIERARCERSGPCGGTGRRHVTGQLACRVSRTFSLHDPKDGHPSLRGDTMTLEALRALGHFERRSNVPPQDGELRLSYSGRIAVRRCDVRVRQQTHVVWAYGEQGTVRDFSLIAQLLLEPSWNALRTALANPDDVRARSRAARAFFDSALHEQARAPRWRTPKEASQEPLVRQRLVSEEYLEEARVLAQHTAQVAGKRVGRRGSWLVMVGLPLLAGYALRGLDYPRPVLAMYALAAAALSYWFSAWLAEAAARASWGALPTHTEFAPPPALAVSSGALALLLALLPASWLPLPSDKVSGIYTQGTDRVLVLAMEHDRLQVRHVDVAHTCTRDWVLKRGSDDDFEHADPQKDGVRYLREAGASFVLLPDATRGCGDHREPRHLKHRGGAVSCVVAVDEAALRGLAGAPDDELARGERVHALPWSLDGREVIVRSEDGAGVLQRSALSCDAGALPKLHAALFARTPRSAPAARARAREAVHARAVP